MTPLVQNQHMKGLDHEQRLLAPTLLLFTLWWVILIIEDLLVTIDKYCS